MAPTLQLAVQHLVAADDDDHAHGEAGQDSHRRRHDLPGAEALDCGVQIVSRLLLVELEVHRLAAGFLHGADAADVLGEGAVGDGGGVAGAAEA